MIQKRQSLLAVLMLGLAIFSGCSKNNDDDVIDDRKDNVAELSDAFFEKVNYIGAFGTTDWTTGWTNFNPNAADYPATTATLEGAITADRTLTKGVYLLKGFVYVKNNATLTIPAGTIIRGDKNSKGALIVTRGAKLVANGTATEPIVFTSNMAAGQRNPGDWGGIILLGKAKNNLPGGEGVIEGGVDDASGAGKHGGSDDSDNSGSLKYVRVEYPGVEFTPNNEINGLTFGSVGSGTTIDHIQVSFCGDDSYEWFGGTVNAKYLVSIGTVDDVFDFDNGYSGKLQFLVGLRTPENFDAAGQSNGIEADNSESQFTTSPRTRPVISNMTIVGPGNNANVRHEYANLWRRGAKFVLANSIFINARYGLDIRDKETGDALKDGSSIMKNNIYQSFDKELVADGKNANNNAPSFDTVQELQTYFDSKNNRRITQADAANLLNSPFSLTAPNFTLKANSAAATGASF
ncbi:hypothetical protein [Arcticibacter sp. MXS-1]|uniref:hypothetical protein n=1 Tax=Arcticibacter sp. MXS-1 TaxID=3341726 RepID=UPI0035A83192